MRVHTTRLQLGRRPRTRLREIARYARRKHPERFIGPGAGKRKLARQGSVEGERHDLAS